MTLALFRGARSALVVRTTAETALRISLLLDGRGRSRVRTGVGFLDHLLAQVAFHGRFDLDVVAGGDVDVDEHHTVEDVMAALGVALRKALGTREGLTRYGSATVPMDEARATAAVDLVRRPHAEIALSFQGDRVGGLALTLLPHALERFAIEAGCTVHVEAAGERRSPRRGSRIQGARSGARGSLLSRRHGPELDEGAALTTREKQPVSTDREPSPLDPPPTGYARCSRVATPGEARLRRTLQRSVAKGRV